jgi:RNA polymerase sigma factor (sigma-70 family)
LVKNLELIGRAINFAARHWGIAPSDTEDFASEVKLQLIENDYAVLRSFEGRSSLATFISTVVQRMAIDYNNRAWGRWRASAGAKRLGALAIDLEELLLRDRRTLNEAVTLLGSKHQGVTLESLQALAAKLPKRAPPRRIIPLDDVSQEKLTRPADANEAVVAEERRSAARKLSELFAAILGRLPHQDRLILQFRFEGNMTVAQIARSLSLDQKATYRRIEQTLRKIRRELEREGIKPPDAADLIEKDEIFVHFDIGNQILRQSMLDDERTGPHTEES